MPALAADWGDIDGNGIPSLVPAKNEGIAMFIPQCVYGRPYAGQTPVYLDKCWPQNKDRITATGAKKTTYLFLCMPQSANDNLTPSPEVQADALCDHAQLVAFRDHVPFIDVEEKSSLDADGYFQWVLRAARQVRKRLGVWPGLYLSNRVWVEYMGNRADAGELKNCPLWLAKPWPWAPGTPIHLDGAPGYSPNLIAAFGNQWFLYQYQGDATGLSGFVSTVDASRPRVFGRGAKGDHVKLAQARLGVTVDGDFGPITEQAVKDLQKKYGLTVDGIIGLETECVLFWCNPAPLAA